MNRPLSAAALGTILAISAHGTQAADEATQAALKANVPQTAAAAASAGLISRAERAFNGFVAACSSGTSRALTDVTVRNLRLEIPFEEPGSRSRPADGSFESRCQAVGGPGARVSDLWIYPTNDDSSVFMQYTLTASGAAPGQHLALVEMRGERIARMVSFVNPPSKIAIGSVSRSSRDGAS